MPTYINQEMDTNIFYFNNMFYIEESTKHEISDAMRFPDEFRYV